MSLLAHGFAALPCAALAVALPAGVLLAGSGARAVEPAAETRPVAARAALRPDDAAAVARWRDRLWTHLNHHKPRARSSSGGTARVRFTIDRSGRVLATALSSSSGDAAQDAEALAMVRRASPFPAPPGIMGETISFTLPVRFQGASRGAMRDPG